MQASLGAYQKAVDLALAEITDQDILGRIWAHDHTVWKSDPTDITNRLGWLDIAERITAELPQIESLLQTVRDREYKHALLLGMGGSSLAPDVFRKTFGVGDGFLELSVLDSTDPGAVVSLAERHDLRRTLFVVSTKSGGTVETLSFFKFFYRKTVEALGAERVGEHFVAITDPGSPLVGLADRLDFLAKFENDPNIGGRYSALSFFGLVPARLIGVDLNTLLERAVSSATHSKDFDPTDAGSCPAVYLGAIMAELAKAGRDKVTLVCSPSIESFGDWVEQLIAESTGKDGTGILPVVGGTPGEPGVYGEDRLFVYLRLDGDSTYDSPVAALEASGQPVVRLHLNDLYDLGGQFFLWEIATAVAGHRLGIHPFDQPNVEAAKVLAREMVAAYQSTGKLPELIPAFAADGIAVYTDNKTDSVSETIDALLGKARPGAYVCVQAYLQPTRETDAALQSLRTKLRDRTRLATTVGYGPRFLHSTGQLHKGDAGEGLFIQLTSDAPADAAIPDKPEANASAMSFGVLKAAQALGDRQALLDADRKVIRFHLGSNVMGGIQSLIEAA